MLKAAKLGRKLRCKDFTFRFSSSPMTTYQHSSVTIFSQPNKNPSCFPSAHSPSTFHFNTSRHYLTTIQNTAAHYDANDEVKPIDLWEEEDEAVPEIGDGGDGGGVVLQNCPWGEKALSIAQDVLLQFGDDIEIFAFKTSPRGYIYVRLDRLCNE